MPNEKITTIHPNILTRAKELRRPQTPQENKLWQHLRKKQLYGLKFRRQHPIHHFILDFFCYEHQLAIEIDGHSHYEPKQQTYDEARTQWLAQRGIKVMRFTNIEVENHLEQVLEKIAKECKMKFFSPPLIPPLGGKNQISLLSTQYH